MNAARGFQVFHPAELDDPLIHIHYLAEHGRIAAWGTTLMVQPDVAYIANMYTLPECRRKGFARAILSVLLSDAARAGARHGLLVSSHAGYLLYQSAGFQRLLDCLVLTSPITSTSLSPVVRRVETGGGILTCRADRRIEPAGPGCLPGSRWLERKRNSI